MYKVVTFEPDVENMVLALYHENPFEIVAMLQRCLKIYYIYKFVKDTKTTY